MTRTFIGAVGVLLFLLTSECAMAEDSDWPCIQPRVAELGTGQVWAGPSLEAAGDWRAHPQVAQLAPRLAARRMSVEDATTEIERFADQLGTDKDQQLTLLFAGIFDVLNAERSRIMAGIERYARGQRNLAERINTTREQINQIAQQPEGAETQSEERAAKVAALQQTLTWDTRIYDERSRTISYVCETPVLIEQRLFALARAIQNRLD